MDSLYFTIAESSYKIVINENIKIQKGYKFKISINNQKHKSECNKATNSTVSTRNGTERTQSNNYASNQSPTTSSSQDNHPTTSQTTHTKPCTCPNTISSSNHSSARSSQSCLPKPLSTRSSTIVRSLPRIRRMWIRVYMKWMCCRIIFPSLRMIIF